MPRYLVFAAVAFAIFYAITSPNGAADTVRAIIGFIVMIATGLSRFINAL